MKKANNFCQFQSGVAYKSVAYRNKRVYNDLFTLRKKYCKYREK